MSGSPLAQGYPPSLVTIDEQMVALGKPELSPGAWLKPEAVAAHRAAVEAWESANPGPAVRWAELDAAYAAEEERLEQLKLDPLQWGFQLMQRRGFPSQAVDLCRTELRDTAAFLATRDWLREGTRWCLTLIGGPGCGKTVAATWAAHQLLTRNFHPRWASCPLLSESNFYDVEGEVRRFRARDAGVLVLDDLGEGKREQKSEPWNAWLDDVLTTRHANHKKTIITTNRSPAELRSWLGARLADRLAEGVITSTAEPSLRGMRETEAAP